MMISWGLSLSIASVLVGAWLVIWYLRQQPTSGGVVPYAPIVIRDIQRGERRDDD